MRVLTFTAGLAAGYVLGSRAGRGKYDQIVAATRKAQDHPTVVQVQQKARELLGAMSDPTASYPDTAVPSTTTTASDAPQPDTASASASPIPASRASRRGSSRTRTTPATVTEPPA